MSSAEVRAAITTFVATGCAAGGSVPGVTKVYRAMPWYIDGATWNLSNELGSGAVLFVDLPEDGGDTRLSVPAVQGEKSVDYLVALVVLYQYLIPSASQSPAVPEDAWVGPLDDTLDGLKALLRTDPNLGNPEVIFQAAQSRGDLAVHRVAPRRAPGKVLSWNVLTFHAMEVITA